MNRLKRTILVQITSSSVLRVKLGIEIAQVANKVSFSCHPNAVLLISQTLMVKS